MSFTSLYKNLCLFLDNLSLLLHYLCLFLDYGKQCLVSVSPGQFCIAKSLKVLHVLPKGLVFQLTPVTCTLKKNVAVCRVTCIKLECYLAQKLDLFLC